ncbi:MAG: STAS domain-containing protein [Spirochaetes bacterium]|nr:STAS domain-containing protein [Spirochaetota bacterium]
MANYVIYKLRSDLNNYEIIQNIYEEIKELINKGNKHIVLDFEQVNSINSSAIGKLLFLNNLITSKNGKISFIRVNDNLKKLFNILLIDKLFDFYDKESEIID